MACLSIDPRHTDIFSIDSRQGREVTAGILYIGNLRIGIFVAS